MTIRKGIAASCCLFGIALFVVGGYYLWSAPVEHGVVGVIAILAAFLLHAIFWVLWP